MRDTKNNINIKKLFDDILDKKFSKNKISGYDPLEVDIFLDNVRGCLVSLHNSINELETIVRNKKEEIFKLQQKLTMKEEIIKKHEYTINSLIKDGYEKQRFARELGDLRATISEMKNEKSK